MGQQISPMYGTLLFDAETEYILVVLLVTLVYLLSVQFQALCYEDENVVCSLNLYLL